jgi:hypothetical protein
MTKPLQPEPGAVEATPPTGPIPEDNLPGHHPEQEQDKPTGPPPRPRARGGTATATATAATRTAAPSVEGTATATITDLGSARAPDEAEASFRFDFEPRVAPFSYALGITPWTTAVDVRDGELRVRFGPWSLATSLDNVAGTEVTGPYSWIKVAGPPHLSLKDRGLTFATSTRRGLCICFREPVPAPVPGLRKVLKHPALTVTVEDVDALAQVIRPR